MTARRFRLDFPQTPRALIMTVVIAGSELAMLALAFFGVIPWLAAVIALVLVEGALYGRKWWNKRQARAAAEAATRAAQPKVEIQTLRRRTPPAPE